ncbi:MAG: MMPL family transporter [Pseudomonadota bacterium]|nr:MMPL family transporter [Pseudomonadota bacterium]
MKIERFVKSALRRLATFQIEHPWPILLFVAALSALAVWYTANNLGIQAGQSDLISPRERLIQIAKQYREFEQLDSFIAVIEGPEGRALDFLWRLVPRLEADRRNFAQVFYRLDPEALKPWLLLYIEEKDLRRLAENFTENKRFLEEVSRLPTLENFLAQLNHELSRRVVDELFTGFLEDRRKEREPLDPAFLIRLLEELDRSLTGRGPFRSPWEAMLSERVAGDTSREGYFWTADKRCLLVFVTPVHLENDFTGSKRSLAALRKAVADIRADFPDIAAGVTGPEALNADQMSAAMTDMELATFISLAGLTVLFIIFRRSLRRPVFELIILIVALTWCFGLTTLVVGHLNILSITFAPLILGLGIDNGAHWFARYQEAEQSARFSTRAELLRETMDRIGPGILLAGTSLALSFLPLTLTGFKGLVELGIICGLGMLAMTLATLLTLPALVMVFDRPFAGRWRTVRIPHAKPLFPLTRRRAVLILAVGAVALALSAWRAAAVRFDLNMLHLQSPRVESVIWEHRLLDGSDLSSIFGEMLAPSLEELRAKTRALESLPTVARVESIDKILPGNQEAKRRHLAGMRPLLKGVEIAALPEREVEVAALMETLGRLRFKMLDAPEGDKKLREQMARARGLIDGIRRELEQADPGRRQRALSRFENSLRVDLADKLELLRLNAQAGPLTAAELPPALRERFVSSDGRFLLKIFPRGDAWEPRFLERFVRELRSVDPEVAGDPVTLSIFTREFRDSTILAALLSILFMFLFLAAIMRECKAALLALSPLLAGTILTFGLMPPFGIDLNLANGIFLPLIAGAGVEYGVIIVHRWRQERNRGEKTAALPAATGWGVVLAGLTTTFGFGSLMISSHRGISSLGALTVIGSLAVLAAAVILLPAALELMDRRNGASPPAERPADKNLSGDN